MAKTVTIEVEAKIDSAIKKIDRLENELDDVKRTAKTASTNIRSIAKSVRSVSRAFRGLGGAIKASGIAATLQILGAAKDSFLETQEIRDTVDVTMKTTSNFISGVVTAFKEGEIGISNFGAKMAEIGENSVKSARDIIKLQNEAVIANAQIQLQQLDSQKLAEEQRQIRDDVTKSIEERIAANTKLGTVLDEQLEKEKELAMIDVRLAAISLAINDNVKNRVASYEALTKLAEIDERIAGQRSEQLTNQNALLEEQLEIQLLAYQGTSNLFERFRGTNVEFIEQQRKRTQILQDEELRRLTIIRNSAAEGTLIRAQAAADIARLDEEIQQSNLDFDQQVRDAKISNAMAAVSAINDIAQTFAEDNKEMAISAAIINTLLGITSVWAGNAQVPFFVKAAQSAAVAVAGFANVMKIKNTPVRDGGTGSAAQPGAGITPNPSINISTGQAAQFQVAEAIRAQSNQPTRAFVVSSDVTTQQGLDRRIGTEATFGG